MTQEINVGEYGKAIPFDVSEDVSSNTNQLYFKKPDGTILKKDAVVGLTNLQTAKGLFLANQYVTYTPISSDIDVSGRWMARVVSDSGTSLVKTDWQKLEVRA
jgi:hypothetical protein